MQYSISEIYESVQGEGVNTGKRVVILRLSGCNLDCQWCDTDHSPSLFMTEREVVSYIDAFSSGTVLLTGGEPTIQNIRPLCEEIRAAGYRIFLETNGTTDLEKVRDVIDWITVSPKLDSKTKNAAIVDEVKVIASDDLDMTDLLAWSCVPYRFLVPCDYGDGRSRLSQTISMLSEINEEREDNQKWILMQQVHKQLLIR